MLSPWIAPATLVAISFVVVFYQVFVSLVSDWSNDDNYSHGFFIIPLAAYFAWERRDRLQALALRPSWWGLALLIASLAVLLAGLLGAELFLTRVAIIGALAGIVLFVLGWGHLRRLAFPIAFLLLMIPIPAIVFNQIAFPLQLLASQAGEIALRGLDVPVLREGNIMILANTTLEVAEACSGIRSLIALLTLAIVYGYFTDPRPTIRTLLALTTIPIAVLSNALRVAGTGAAAHYYGPEAAEGFFHSFSGWAVFVTAFLLFFGVAKIVQWIVPLGPDAGAPIPALGTSSISAQVRP